MLVIKNIWKRADVIRAVFALVVTIVFALFDRRLA